jgi:hypothetical protein
MNKLIASLILIGLTFSSPAYSAVSQNYSEKILAQEHLFADKEECTNKVVITNLRNILCKGNILKIAFDCEFWSHKAKAGNKICFSFLESVYTQEGTLIIPAGTKVQATVLQIEKQKVFNKNARVYLRYDNIILPNCQSQNLNAKTHTKDGTLKEGAWHTAGKLAASTLGLGAIGAGAGVGFSFIPNPAKIGTGLAIGIPVGCSVGLIVGLVTPGVKYHAKQCEYIKIILCDELSLPKCE